MPGRADEIVVVDGLQKTYGDTLAVDHISFAVQRGETFGLLGPNGAGKTSTLECLEGLRLPDGGMLRVGGIDPARTPRKLRDVIGVQLQSSALPESLTPHEAMRLFCAYHHVAPRYDLLERLGLASKDSAQYCELSTGQQRRLSLALAVAHSPQVLFLDEPTAGLDVGARSELHDLIRELSRDGTSVILATHDMAEAEEMADRVAILLHGRLVATGTPLEITSAGAGLTRISVRTQNGCLGDGILGLPSVSQRISRDEYAILYSSDVGPTLASIIAHIERSGDTLLDLRVERPSLEERFLEITRSGASQ